MSALRQTAKTGWDTPRPVFSHCGNSLPHRKLWPQSAALSKQAGAWMRGQMQLQAVGSGVWVASPTRKIAASGRKQRANTGYDNDPNRIVQPTAAISSSFPGSDAQPRKRALGGTQPGIPLFTDKRRPDRGAFSSTSRASPSRAVVTLSLIHI